jgi:transcriptional regulator of acetoin/glycerol metabolism
MIDTQTLPTNQPEIAVERAYSELLTLEQVERIWFFAAISRARTRTEAMKNLGMSRATFYRKLRWYGLPS